MKSILAMPHPRHKDLYWQAQQHVESVLGRFSMYHHRQSMYRRHLSLQLSAEERRKRFPLVIQRNCA